MSTANNPDPLPIGTLDIRTAGRDFHDMSRNGLSLNITTVVHSDPSRPTTRRNFFAFGEQPPRPDVASHHGESIGQNVATLDGNPRDVKGKATIFSTLSLGRLSRRFIRRKTDPLTVNEGVRTQPEASGSSNLAPDVWDRADEREVAIESVEESLLSPSKARESAFHEVYVRSLLNAGFGLPCWEPRPFPYQIHTRGASPGDVGIYTTETGFRRNFNIWEDSCAIQALAKVCGISNDRSSLSGEVITQHDVLCQGQAIAPGASSESCPPPQSSSKPFWVMREFHYNSGSGGILAPLTSADLEATDDLEAMKAYIIDNAELLYRFANRCRSPGKKVPLYIVSGSIKSEIWASAAYQSCVEQGRDVHRVLHLAHIPTDVGGNGSPEYQWTKTPQSTLTRLGDSGVPGLKNQALFLQGFKLAFSSQFFQRMEEDSLAPSPSSADGSQGQGTSSNLPRESSGGSRSADGNGSPAQDSPSHPGGPSSGSSGGSRSSDGNCPPAQDVTWHPGGSYVARWGLNTLETPQKPSHLSSGQESRIEDSGDGDVGFSQFPCNSEESYHPCDVINESLLEMSGADIALSHDEDWLRLLRHTTFNSDPQRSDPLSRQLGDVIDMQLIRPGVTDKRRVSVCNGVVFILPSRNSSPPHVPAASVSEEKVGQQGSSIPHPSKSPNPQEESGVLLEPVGEPETERIFQKSLRYRKRPSMQRLSSGRRAPWMRGTREGDPEHPLAKGFKAYSSSTRGSLFGGTGAPWRRYQSQDDPEYPHFEADPSRDVVVIVMGPTGVGKSRFVNACVGEEVTEVGHRMESCTKNVSYHPLELPESHPTCPGRRIVLVDTPGFDDTYESPYETLRTIGTALASIYDHNIYVGNVLYLNSVAQKRMFGSMKLNFDMFREICGKRSSTKITMATTHWDSAEIESPGAGGAREDEFRTNFWKDVLDEGATLERIESYDSDPGRILEDILRKTQETEVHKRELQIQGELVDMEKKLRQTEAGKKLRYTAKEIDEVRARLRRAGPLCLEERRLEMVEMQDHLGSIATAEGKWFSRIIKGAFRLPGRNRSGSTSHNTEIVREPSWSLSVNQN